MYARTMTIAFSIVGTTMTAATLHAVTVATLDLSAGATASVQYDVAVGPDVRFDMTAADGGSSETHETDVLFGFDYGTVRSSNGAQLSWCNGKRKGATPGRIVPLFGLRSIDGPDLLLLGDAAEHDFQAGGEVLQVENGVLVDAPFLQVRDASLLEDVSQLLDAAWVETLPHFTGLATYEVLGTMAFTESDTTLPGDFDVDFDVDGTDALVWQRGPASSNVDLAIWRANYGSPGVVPAALSATTTVPEPTMTVLLLSAVLPMFLRPTRRANTAS